MILGIRLSLNNLMRVFVTLITVITFNSCVDKNNGNIDFYYPKHGINGVSVPVIAITEDGSVIEQNMNVDFMGQNHDLLFRFRISYFDYLPQQNESFDVIEYVDIIEDTINTRLVLEKNKAYKLDHVLYVDSLGSLVLEEGSQLYIEDGIDIISLGKIEINGAKTNPVLITSFNSFWGGIQSFGGSIEINNLIISHSGGNDKIKIRHSYSQPAIYMEGDGNFKASNLYIINCKGKAMYIKQSVVNINKSLFADCDTGPEINFSKVRLDSVICMNIPDSFDGEDDDNDALYIFGRHKKFKNSPPLLNNLMLGFAKDDGFDHGKTDIEISNLLVYRVKDKAVSLEGGKIKMKNILLSNSRVLIGVKQNSHIKIDSIYLSDYGERTDMHKHMKQNPTLDISNEFKILDIEHESKAYWFPIF